MLSQVHVALNIFYQHIVYVYSGVATTITFVFAMFILRPIRLLSWDSSCSICCSSCGVSVHRNMSSAKRRLRLEKKCPSIFKPLFSQFNLLKFNMLSNVAVNSLGEMVLLLLILICSLSLCRCTVSVTELSAYIYMSFRISMYTSSIPCSCNDVNIAWVCTESNAFSKSTKATVVAGITAYQQSRLFTVLYLSDKYPVHNLNNQMKHVCFSQFSASFCPTHT